MNLGGVLTAMVTPFDAQGRVDDDAFVRMLHHLLEHGSDGVVVAGTTGESPTLTDAEKEHLWRLAVSEAGGAMVIAGTGSNDTAHSVEMTERATEAGVDAVLVVTPYYNKPNVRGLKAHFTAVANATDRPLVIYNIPSRCVIDIPNELLRELAEVPNISAVKQARMEGIEPIDGMDLLAGNDDTFARTLDAGGTGGILVASHIVGEQMKRMIEEPEQRAAIDRSLADVFAALSVTSNPIPVKTALDMLGHDVGGLRLPLVEASDDERAEIRAMLERHDLLTKV